MVEELLLDWLDLFLTVEEKYMLTTWQMGVSLSTQSMQCFLVPVTNITCTFDAGHLVDR